MEVLQAPATPSSASATRRRPPLPALTGIRCFAALNLVFFHFSDPHQFGPLRPVVDGGYISVSFFLLLSGFILTYNYADRAEAGNLPSRTFWFARFTRLYPVYLFSLLISIGMLADEFHVQTRPNFAMGLLLTPLLLQGWSPVLATFWNTPAWTMCTEVFFYLLFPWLISRRRPKERNSLLLMLLVLWASGLVLPALYMHFHPDGAAPIDRYSSGIWLRALKFMPMQHLTSFLFGMALALLNDHIGAKSRARLVLGLAGFAGLYVVLYYAERVPYVLLHDGLLMPLFGAVILCLAGSNLLSRFFGLMPFLLIGECSYCLYLLHFNLWNLLHDSHLLDKAGLAVLDPWLSYVLLVGAALLTKRWVERPGKAWLQQHLRF